ncbi:MAG: hypothetical protein RRA94_03980, partial [Bacteroidota bacterium]|nr:hypothetical protein [Bacteroidota bacterium]
MQKFHQQKQSSCPRSGDRWHWRRKHHVIIWLFLFIFHAPDLFAQPLAPERVPVTFPVQFTRNDGQWDASVRFAVLHQASQVSLRSDGIDIVPPRKRVLDLPGLEMKREIRNVVSVRYVNPSPNMRLVGADTVGTAMHFYAGGTPDSCFEHVASFGTIRYQNVWDGCDIEYAPDGTHLRERIILYPGADVSQVRIVCTGGIGNIIGAAKISSSTSGAEAGLFLNTSGETVSLRYTPGVLRDTIVLETEFRTFFGDEKGYQVSERCRVMPNGSILLTGLGKAPYMARPHYFPPQDSSCNNSPSYIAEFKCDGRELRFCTTFYSSTFSGDRRLRATVDDTTGYFLLTGGENDPNGGFEACRMPVRTPFLDTLWTSRGAGSWLGRVSRDGILSIATHIDGIAGLEVTRLHDGGILLTGLCFLHPNLAKPFRYYTREPAEEHPGILLKLSATADSVLIGVNLELFGDTIYPVFATELPDGSIAIAGMTDQSPRTVNAWQAARGGMIDAYLARLTADMDSVLWATFLGGAEDEFLFYHDGYGPFKFSPNAWDNRMWAIVGGPNHIQSYTHDRGYFDNLLTDEAGGIWVCGTTTSPSMPELPGTGLRSTRGSTDMFLARFTAEGQPTMLRSFGGETPGNSGTIDPDDWNHRVYRDAEQACSIEILPCGRCLVTGWAYTIDFPQHAALPGDPWQFLPERLTVSTLAVYDKWGTLHHSGWYPEYLSNHQRYDPTGHLVTPVHTMYGKNLDRFDPDSVRIYNAFQPNYGGYGPDAILTRQYLPLCGEDAVSCAFTVPDTIRHDSTRGYLSHSFIPLDVTITNPDPTRAVFDLQAELRLPPGLVLVPDTMPLLLDAAPMLAPGDTAYALWLLQVRPDLIADTLLPITVVTHYRWADHLDNCLQSHGGCRAEIVYARRDSKRMELSCDLDAPMSLMIDATGERYVSDTIPVTLTLRNLGLEAVLPGEVALHVRVEGEPGTAGVSLLPAGDHIHPLDRLLPNEEVQTQWIVHVDRRGFDREVTFEAVVRDEIGQLPVSCLTTVHVPGIPALRCSLTAPDALYPVSGTDFPDFAVEVRLENIVDTLIRRVEAEIDLSQAPHLTMSSGETARHYLGPTAAAATRTSLWQLAVDPAPQDSSTETITVWYWYQEDSTRRSCAIDIRMIPVIQSSVCSITAPAVLSVDDSVLLPSPFTLDYRLHNTGNEALDVGRYVLSIAPSAGLLALDPLSVAGGTLAPGTAADISWRVQAQALQSARSAVLTVEALSMQDSVVSICTHSIGIPAIDGLRCTLQAEDTVRFLRNPPGYQPSPLNLQLDLRNVLDESHTNIEAIIDLTQAPRFMLDPSETASK